VLLAFDTATPQVTVALHDGDAVIAEYSASESMRHGEMLAPGIAEVLARAGAISQDITAVAVGVGPGPFTGLRVGLVTARTMGMALEIPVYGVCSLDVLAAEAIDGGLTDFFVATDARRKEVYLAEYAEGQRISGPDVVRPADAATDALVVGRGATLYPESFPRAAGPEHPSAAVLCDVVVRERFELLDPEPLYLRRPDTMEPRQPKRVS
jgi:tRNA threonylcarbamoyl adenosine modification protein YeaZ